MTYLKGIQSLACDNKGSKEQTIRNLEMFTKAEGRTVVSPVMIISYETLRAYSYIIKETEIGLMLCDEGHRLKNSSNQTYQALCSLNVKRRVILSGTPLQNDLSEYYSLLTFANPLLFGSDAKFRKDFENPILKGRDSLASDAAKLKGAETLKELMTVSNRFMIRRTAALLTKYLPVKYEHVVFCKLTPLQTAIYESFISSKAMNKLLDEESGNGQLPLQSITLLKKLCNHPSLCITGDTGGSGGSRMKKVSRDSLQSSVDLNLYPEDYDFGGCEVGYSGKLLLLEQMMTKYLNALKLTIRMRKTTDDKIVLISNYTQTLDLFAKMCRAKQWGCIRLDGSLSIPKSLLFASFI